MTVAGDIQRTACGLHDLAQAPREQWLRILHEIEGLKIIGGVSEGVPGAALALSLAAKSVARQMPFAAKDSETELRGVALALSNILMIELGCAGFPIEAPWWNKQ